MSHFHADLVIYGGTSAAVTAAVQAARLGCTVIVVSPDRHLGGMTSSGLGFTDAGNTGVIGGLALDFYRGLYAYYMKDGPWQWEDRDDFGNRGQDTPALDHDRKACWCFEPSAAEAVFEAFAAEADLGIHRDAWLDPAGVDVEKGWITSLCTLAGHTYHGRVFLDATYEGDLMAAAGVPYHLGREAHAVYGETWNGVQTGVLHHFHFFDRDVSPYVIPGKPESGLLPLISPEPPGEHGQGDRKVQAYCFRMCLSDHPGNRIPFPRPPGYDPDEFVLFLRGWAGRDDFFEKFDRIPNRKTDTNNHGPVSTDHIGASWDYPEASYARRRAIIAEHARYQQSLMYFVQNDPRVPAYIHAGMQRWGLPQDEFTDNGGWPRQLYVREARRMIGLGVMTEHEVLGRRPVPRPVGMGSYNLDSHNVQRYVRPDGSVQNEGDIEVRPPGPYGISYDCLVPGEGGVLNLLVPVCLSSSHIAYGSIRMEPVFMILGQSAAAAACLAIDEGVAVQDVDDAALRAALLGAGQVLPK
jgi:hypothetical protein